MTDTFDDIVPDVIYTRAGCKVWDHLCGKIVQEFIAKPATLFYQVYKKESEAVVVLWHQR
jgi:hypothetical protein